MILQAGNYIRIKKTVPLDLYTYTKPDTVWKLVKDWSAADSAVLLDASDVPTVPWHRNSIWEIPTDHIEPFTLTRLRSIIYNVVT